MTNPFNPARHVIEPHLPPQMSGEEQAYQAGRESPSAVYDLVDHLRSLARRIEDEGCNSDTVDQLEALKNEAEDLLDERR